MKRYFHLTAIAVAFGIIDFVVKGTTPWASLAPFIQGWSWHFFVFFAYFVFVLFYSLRYDNKFFLFFAALCIYINEDVTYYILASISHARLLYNNWLFHNLNEYLLGIFYLNTMAFWSIKIWEDR